MVTHAEVSVVVNGALESSDTFYDETLLSEFIETIHQEAIEDGYRTEVYVLYHEHVSGIDCSCAQYVTDHHPQYEWNGDNDS